MFLKAQNPDRRSSESPSGSLPQAIAIDIEMISLGWDKIQDVDLRVDKPCECGGSEPTSYPD